MTTNNILSDFIQNLPKAELHIHIEGSLEPEFMFQLAKKNNISLPYQSIQDIKKAYQFHNLQSFLDIYYAGASVLRTEEDFYILTQAYLKKAWSQGVKHAEIFFDPQTHLQRGISFETVIRGIHKACSDSPVSTQLIMCFLRHLPEQDAIKTLHLALPYKNFIQGVGLDSSEVGNPPSKFEKVFKMAQKAGFDGVAHAGEEGPVAYIHEAINALNIKRIDHGNQCIVDPDLMRYLAENQIPLTLCPLSNLELKVIDKLENHPIKKMMDAQLVTTVNSDDPAYFGGYINENYYELARALKLSIPDLEQLAINSFAGSWLNPNEKASYIDQIRKYTNEFLLNKSS